MAENASPLPVGELRHAESGACVRYTLFGGQVLSWMAGGRERLFLSPKAVMDGSAPIRGGVPICFPQFNQRGPLPKHGFARTRLWQELQAPQQLADGSMRAVLALRDDAQTRALWPHAFELRLVLTLQARELDLRLELDNRGDTALDFAAALHTYFAVQAIESTMLDGLQGCAQWETLAHVHQTASGQPLRFEAEFDSVFAAAAGPLHIVESPSGSVAGNVVGSVAGNASGRAPDEGSRLRIEQSPSFQETVVWNPHRALCAKLADMEPEGYRQMLCVEAAQLLEPVSLPPGQTWVGWQRMAV